MYSNTCTQTLKHTHIYVNVTYNMHMFTPQCFELPSEQRATYSLSLSLARNPPPLDYREQNINISKNKACVCSTDCEYDSILCISNKSYVAVACLL